MRDHDSIIVDNFQGMFARGIWGTADVAGNPVLDLHDDTPEGHAEYCENLSFGYRGLRSREPFTNADLSGNQVSNIAKLFVYKPASGVSRLLWLDTTGKLWDSGFLGGYPGAGWILNIGTMTNCSIISMFGRAYITPSDGVRGLAGESVYVYAGAGAAARATGGSAPGGSGAYALGAAGKIEAGDHLFGVVYETDTGFLTPPSALQRLTIPTGGNLQVNVTVIPVGGASISKVHIVATKSIFGYNGNPKDYELFLVPTANGGVVNNGVVVTTLNFFDSDLVSSADYLYDEFVNVPAGVGLCDYNGRLMVWGINGKDGYLYGSKSGEPESVSQVDGFLAASPADSAGPIKASIPFRGNFYMHKSARAFVTSDNGNALSTWAVEQLDASIGTEPNGIAVVNDAQGMSEDCFLVAATSGIVKFNGTYAERPLTWKIDAIWRDIYYTNIKDLKLYLDSVHKRIYCLAPFYADNNNKKIWSNNGTVKNLLLMGDYSEGLDWEHIKWTWYRIKRASFNSIVLFDYNSSAQMNTLVVSGGANLCVAYLQPVSSVNNLTGNFGGSDDVHFYINPPQAIPYEVTFPVIPDNQEGELNHFAAISFRMVCYYSAATKPWDITIYDGNNNVLVTHTISIGSTAQDYVLLLNITAERIKVKFSYTPQESSPPNNTPAAFSLHRARIFYKPIWSARPL